MKRDSIQTFFVYVENIHYLDINESHPYIVVVIGGKSSVGIKRFGNSHFDLDTIPTPYQKSEPYQMTKGPLGHSFNFLTPSSAVPNKALFYNSLVLIELGINAQPLDPATRFPKRINDRDLIIIP
ncbi:Hypothetical predicted protein [Octopus vulgaris]|uniref:Uncharacterized protein n=1 Tax=Octopus vulgaris TaxID=6645 RepID=A0AA36AVK9_OCTVU|nr:Hypothetical predicted protein [Octopus vulgaris]